MNKHTAMHLFVGVIIVLTSFSSSFAENPVGPHPKLPPPVVGSGTSAPPRVIGWPRGQKPIAPEGFKVELYASSLKSPRWLYSLPNGDVLVSEATGEFGSPNQIELFRSLSPTGAPELRKVFLKKLNQPFGMLLLNGWFYVANTDSIVRYRYLDGMTEITTQGEKILDLPSSGYHGHWTRNIIANPEGTKIYVAIGSKSNVGEDGMDIEKRRAMILEINPDGSEERIFADGLRNPIGFAFYPGTKNLWAAVNERDWLGDNVPPDYFTHVQEGGFYGWPYSYWGSNEDPRWKGERPDLVKKAIVPDFALGAHTASLSVNFYTGGSFPEKYKGGAFIGQHGSWNSTEMRGYCVYFVPFKEGKPSGIGEPFLTGFIADLKKNRAYGRPVAVITLKDGSLLVSDDAGGKIWRVSVK